MTRMTSYREQRGRFALPLLDQVPAPPPRPAPPPPRTRPPPADAPAPPSGRRGRRGPGRRRYPATLRPALEFAAVDSDSR